MAARRRGRPPKSEATRKSEPVSIRLTPELRARLDEERMSDKPSRTLSQEIEMRIEESFYFDNRLKQLLGGADYYYFLLRILAQQIAFIEHQTGRRFVEDPFAFDQVKAAIDTILDHFKPPGPLSPPEHLTSVIDERSITLLGKRAALLALAQLEIAKMSSGDLPFLPDSVNPNAASRRLFQWMQKSALAELEEDWRQTTAIARKPRRKPQ
jgi:predicted DNA-binding protein